MHADVGEALATIFAGIEKLRSCCENGRRFTIDGRLVGDIGELIAARDFDISLDAKSRKDHDGCLTANPMRLKREGLQARLGTHEYPCGSGLLVRFVSTEVLTPRRRSATHRQHESPAQPWQVRPNGVRWKRKLDGLVRRALRTWLSHAPPPLAEAWTYAGAARAEES
jgi:hypothetical protein